MTCFDPTFPFGPYQRFTYGSLEVILNYTDHRWMGGQGSTLLDEWGYDRYQDPEYLAKTRYGYLGASHWQAPPHNAPYKFEWKLQTLPEADYYTLWAMYRQSLRDRQPIRLDDARLALDEPTPRTRGKVGTVIGAPVVAGMEFFFPRFDIVLDLGRDRGRWQNGYTLNMTAIEYDPDRPVVGDIP
jgi:hypothetical protein